MADSDGPTPIPGNGRSSEDDAKFDALMAHLKQMGLDQKTHADSVSETLSGVDVSMATMSANIENIQSNNERDRVELKQSLKEAHVRINDTDKIVAENTSTLRGQDDWITKVEKKAENAEDGVVQIKSTVKEHGTRLDKVESNAGLPKATTTGNGGKNKDGKNGWSLQSWLLIIGAITTALTTVIGAIAMYWGKKPVTSENPDTPTGIHAPEEPGN